MVKALSDLMAALPVSDYKAYNTDEVEVMGLCLDSRQVQSGYMFFAMQGTQHKATEFVKKAISKGAKVICCDESLCHDVEQMLPNNFPFVVVKELSANISQIAHVFFACPSEKMHVVAITGTDGKTSVSHYVAQLLEQAAVIGTIGNGYPNKLQQATHTTPNAIELQMLMFQFNEAGVETVAMEASSHGLSQGRLNAINIDTAVLTNFSRDHLDFHGTLEAYKAAKKILFTQFTVKNIVINYSDQFGKEIYQELINNNAYNVYAYALNAKEKVKGLVDAVISKVLPTGFVLNLSYNGEHQLVTLYLMGKFNIENALAVLCAVMAKGVSFSQACKNLEKLQPITGRMQLLNYHDDFSIVIDYAHTPHALVSAVESVKLHCQGSVICVFGCGGDRDKGKRPLMAQAASVANYAIVTSDNPRTENPDEIIKDILQGFESYDAYDVEINRADAIRVAIDKAKPNDVVLIAGKGHEQYQIIGKEKIFYSDETVVRDYLGVAA